MDMDYLAENSYQLIYFRTILDLSSELSICHETRFRSTTASRRLHEDGGAPILVDCTRPHLPGADGFFHLSLLSIWFRCQESHTLAAYGSY